MDANKVHEIVKTDNLIMTMFKQLTKEKDVKKNQEIRTEMLRLKNKAETLKQELKDKK